MRANSATARSRIPSRSMDFTSSGISLPRKLDAPRRAIWIVDSGQSRRRTGREYLAALHEGQIEERIFVEFVSRRRSVLLTPLTISHPMARNKVNGRTRPRFARSH